MGVDPGWDRCGFGIVDETPARIASGVIQTDKEWTYLERINVIYNGILHLVRSNGVEVAGVEKPYVGDNIGKRIIEIVGVWSVVTLAIHRCGCSYMELSNSQVKAAVSGGRADKEQVRRGVETILEINLDGKLDDESDALACAVCARDKYHLMQLVREVDDNYRV